MIVNNSKQEDPLLSSLSTVPPSSEVGDLQGPMAVSLVGLQGGRKRPLGRGKECQAYLLQPPGLQEMSQEVTRYWGQGYRRAEGKEI